MMEKKTIVVSAVNLNRGGTLRILRDCLAYLSALAADGQYRIVAVVYSQALVDFPNIEYIETQWPKKRWVNRLWFEYVSLRKISETLQPVDLWLSLHDTSPSVKAKRQAVYCHNSFPFLKWTANDLLFAPKIVLFTLFSRFFYQKNIHRNRYVVVQQEWFRAAFVRMFGLAYSNIIVAPPAVEQVATVDASTTEKNEKFTFIYPAISDSHKNFECICRAAAQLWEKGIRNFEVVLTISGQENPYTGWLMKKWGSIPALRFVGYLDRTSLFAYFAKSDGLLFPSRVETWGLPITEFAYFNKPMLLADLPYARETAQGCAKVAFFPPSEPAVLAEQMQALIAGDSRILQKVDVKPLQAPTAHSWEDMFSTLLTN